MNRQTLKKLTAGVLSLSLLAGCSSGAGEKAASAVDVNNLSLEEIETGAKTEGELASVGMPDTWANWGQTWDELEKKYELKHFDTDMSSAEELAKFESEGENGTADIGDVGIAFGPIAEEKSLTLPYKTSYWDEIPEWAKDDNGDWVVGYTGTLAFITDKNKVKETPTSWEDLKNGDYKVAVGDVMTANQAQFAVLAAAYAFGGDEKNIQPGIDFFAELAKEGRLSTSDPSLANLEKGEIEVAIMWDFNALNYRDKIETKRFDVAIPEEGSVMSGYATIINKHAPNPHAAAAAREYILSDKGQENLARGYARPIRDIELPKEVEAKLLPDEMYNNVQPVEDQKAWEETTKQLPQMWQEEVLIHAN
ncbi:ABC transporter substrate-binding protein [Mesobacillus campisalis]|uniref:ABC transporter substrate-binding protein n=1 Tax=Mesobacillus campisalis TaxID=1408103 RepID=A0A0M2T0R3_9BACI|nr:extracellular solute-binding protein [Mesobacillus campisalis]KKK40018.1 ABC transporter substrate-binding protein [Mesobacillus campisalis]